MSPDERHWVELGDSMMEEPYDWEGNMAAHEKAYGGTAAARRNVQCECGHDSGHHEGDEYGFCLVCACNHYRPVVKAVER